MKEEIKIVNFGFRDDLFFVGYNTGALCWFDKDVIMPLYIVETVSMFRMRYVVEAKEESHSHDEVIMERGNDTFKEFSQEHIDESIFSSREISKEEYLRLFDKDNHYIASWSEEKKLDFINKIDYKE